MRSENVILLILVWLVVIGIAYVITIPPPLFNPSRPPKAELTVYKDDDYIVTIESIDFEVSITEVGFYLTYPNSHRVSNVGANITDPDVYNRYFISDIEPGDPRENITYLDNDRDGNLSMGDSFILEIDWDGPEKDGSSDGNFTNDGPVEDRQHFILGYRPAGKAIASVILETS